MVPVVQSFGISILIIFFAIPFVNTASPALSKSITNPSLPFAYPSFIHVVLMATLTFLVSIELTWFRSVSSASSSTPPLNIYLSNT